MRFEIIAALAVGVLIPGLATCLDFCDNDYRFSFSQITGNFEDYIAGALLVFGAWASIKLRAFAPVFLVLAWAYTTSMMVTSSWGQIDDTLRGESEPYNAAIIVVKLLFLAVCVAALLRSFRRAVPAKSTAQNP